MPWIFFRSRSWRELMVGMFYKLRIVCQLLDAFPVYLFRIFHKSVISKLDRNFLRLIMTLRAFKTTDVFNFHWTVATACFVKLQQFIVIGISLRIHISFPMTVDTPSHR